MKQIIVLIFISLFAIKTNARARIPVCTPCEKADLVEDLPNDETLKEGNEYLNLGYFHKEYGIAFIPAWNSDGRYVLVNEDESTYYDIDESQLAELKQKYNLDLSSNPLSFWKKIGGKLVYLIIIGLIIYGKMPSKDEKEDSVTTE